MKRFGIHWHHPRHHPPDGFFLCLNQYHLPLSVDDPELGHIGKEWFSAFLMLGPPPNAASHDVVNLLNRNYFVATS